jgi:hypothetical protein
MIMVVGMPLASTASEGRGETPAKTGDMCSLKSVLGRGARSKTGRGVRRKHNCRPLGRVTHSSELVQSTQCHGAMVTSAGYELQRKGRGGGARDL